jgi:peptide-methionine (S)-S-oxide reductase
MMRLLPIVALITLSAAACRSAEQQGDAGRASDTSIAASQEPTRLLFDSLMRAGVAHATFAGGCFWCVEPAFDTVPGVIATISGYTGGRVDDPSYEEVSAGGTGHAEAVMIFFDSTTVSYDRLLAIFWRNVDPVTPNRQFCDAGSQYRSAIFYHGAEQRAIAEASKQALVDSRRFDEPIVTEIAAATTFTPAEEYHQNFYRKDPDRYYSYREGCGRDRRLRELWE